MNRRVLLWLLAIALIAGFSALGRWQWQRGEAKASMLERSAKVLRERRALPLAQAQAREDGGYDWVASHGRFLRSPVLLLDNQRRGDAVGVRVLAVWLPLEGRPLLADLGWLPVPGDRRFPQPALPEGQLRLEGLLSPPPGAGLALGPAHAPLEARGRQQRWLLTRVDTAALSAALELPLSARLLRVDPALRIGYQRDLELLANTLPPERHRGYALQWFGLAFATLVTALLLSLRRPPR